MTSQGKKDIRNILGVLIAGVLSAILLAVLFLYFYSPSGQYLAGHTLLDPTILKDISYQDRLSGPGKKKINYQFDHIEFSYYEPNNQYYHNPSVSLENYQEFYWAIANEMSLRDIDLVIQESFTKSRPSLLTIKMHSDENHYDNVFQMVQFIPEDYFRVQLFGENEGEWAYFYQKDIYQRIIRIFTSKKSI